MLLLTSHLQNTVCTVHTYCTIVHTLYTFCTQFLQTVHIFYNLHTYILYKYHTHTLYKCSSQCIICTHTFQAVNILYTPNTYSIILCHVHILCNLYTNLHTVHKEMEIFKLFSYGSIRKFIPMFFK